MSWLARSNRSVLAEWVRTVDRPLMGAMVVLVLIGLVLSLAAGPIAAERLDYDQRLHFVARHAVFAGLAVLVLPAVSLLGPVGVRRVSAGVFLVAFLLMALILVIGHEAKGGQRWLQLGPFSLQPSEMIKPAVIVLSGWLLAQRRLFPDGPWALVALSLFVSTIGLLLIQPDVGQSALLAGAFIVTFFVSGLPWRWALAFAAGGTALAVVLYNTVPHVKSRIDVWFDPTQQAGQVATALNAQAHGGVLGTGPGEGVVKRDIPDGHTDFIYSILAEEYGLVGVVLVVGLFAFITLRGLWLAGLQEDPYRRAAASGLFALFGLQALINLFVNVSLMPPKGMTLPFLSYGGSSALGTALTLGLALALVRRLPIKGFPNRRLAYG
jgi:cell division protein FtsW